MKTTITSLGNSKGVRIPNLLLGESGSGEQVEITAKKGEIRIVPAKPENKKPTTFNAKHLVSIGALGGWNRLEEDKAWAHMQ